MADAAGIEMEILFPALCPKYKTINGQEKDWNE